MIHKGSSLCLDSIVPPYRYKRCVAHHNLSPPHNDHNLCISHRKQTTMHLRQHQASLQKARLSWAQKDMFDTYRKLCIHFLSFLIAIYIAHRSFAIDFTYHRSLKSIYYSHFAKRDVILNFNLGNKNTDYSISNSKINMSLISR